jgi:hypothetical protein
MRSFNLTDFTQLTVFLVLQILYTNNTPFPYAECSLECAVMNKFSVTRKIEVVVPKVTLVYAKNAVINTSTNILVTNIQVNSNVQMKSCETVVTIQYSLSEKNQQQ